MMVVDTHSEHAKSGANFYVAVHIETFITQISQCIKLLICREELHIG